MALRCCTRARTLHYHARGYAHGAQHSGGAQYERVVDAYRDRSVLAQHGGGAQYERVVDAYRDRSVLAQHGGGAQYERVADAYRDRSVLVQHGGGAQYERVADAYRDRSVLAQHGGGAQYERVADAYRDRSVLAQHGGGAQYERVADAYRDRSVLVTGGTGFLGKILIERLLFNCADIGNIYVLMRQKKDVPLHTRLEGMFSLPLFSKLKESNPAALEKVVPVHGDLLEDQLGIADNDRKLLEDNVNMVFHVAASVKFKATFRELMQHNYFGTRKVMDLAKGIRNLESFVYFSTAYSNIARKYLDEKPIAALASREDIDYCLRTNTVDRLQKISSAPVYSFSKNFTEVLVEQERGDLPTIMIRPAAVTACLRDPLPGWMDTWIAHPSFFLEHSRGLVSAAVGHRDVVADVIPADYVANLAIVAAARGRRTKEMLIYNSCTGTMNPITWKEGCDLFRQYALNEGKWDLPPRKLVQSSSYLVVHLLTIFRDRIPALLGDLWLRLKGEQPKYLKLQKRALFMRDNVDALMETSLFFKCTQAWLLAQTLDDHDRERFPFDPSTIKWSEYMPTLYRSIYKYMIEKKKT